MPIENYSLDDIRIILKAFNLPSEPYTSRKNLQCDIYFRMLAGYHEMDLLRDTLDYIGMGLIYEHEFAPDRKVAFLFETQEHINNEIKAIKFAVIVHYKNLNMERVQQLINQANWRQEQASLQEMLESPLAAQFRTIYESIYVECVSFIDTQPLRQYLLQFGMLTNIYRLDEESGVFFTECILMLLFSDEIRRVNLEQIFNHQRQRCEKQLVQWLEKFQKTHAVEYQEIMGLLAIVVKYTLLEAQQNALRNLPAPQDFLTHNEKGKKYFFALPLGDIATILPHLPLTGIIHLLRLRHNPHELIKQLKQQQQIQEQAITAVEQQFKSTVRPLTWGQWGKQSVTGTLAYCYERSYPKLLGQLVPWVMRELTPTSVAERLEKILQQIANLIACLFCFVPQSVRSLSLGLGQLMHPSTLDTFYACSGAGAGLLMMYYAGIFDPLFYLTLSFMTELTHEFLSGRIDLHTASIVPRLSYVPNLATLLRLNMLFILVLISLYTQNTDYLGMGATALGFSELVRRLFIKYSRDLELSAEERVYCEFILTQCGTQLGGWLFTAYAAVRDLTTDRRQAVTEFLQLSENFDGRAEVPDLWFHPWRWLSGSFDTFWRDQSGNYQAICDLGSATEVNCRVVSTQTFPPMVSS